MSRDQDSDIKIQRMNLNNGDMLHATMHAGSHDFNTMVAPSMHSSMKHVTIVEIHMMFLYVCVCQKTFSHNLFSNQNLECPICCKKVLLVKY